jgi:hypothetical protein
MRNHHQNSIFFVILFVIAAGLLAGCGQDDLPEPTLVSEEVEVVEKRPFSSPTPTTIPPTQTPVPALTSTPLATSTPKPSPTSTAVPTNSPTQIPAWNEEITRVATLKSGSTNWSSFSNKFLVDYCSWGSTQSEIGGKIFLAAAPTFEQKDITPENFDCSASPTNLQWNPNESFIIFYGKNKQSEFPYTHLWTIDTNDYIGRLVNPMEIEESGYINFLGWLDNKTFAHAGRCGSGCSYAAIVSLPTGEYSSSGLVFGSFFEPNNRYVPANDGMDKWSSVTTAILSEEIENDYEFLENGSHIRFLSLDYTPSREFTFNSHFEDWLPQSNKMLVTTWEKKLDLYNHDFFHSPPVTDLQLWDVPSNELTMLVPEGIYGRFSPNANYLASLTTEDSNAVLQLLDLTTSQTIFSIPSSATQEGYYNEIVPYFSFSPRNNLFAFFTPREVTLSEQKLPITANSTTSSYLNIFSLDQNQIILSQPNNPSELSWSPNGDQLIYRDKDNNFNIIEIESGNLIPITTSGGDQIFNPQWSFDGSYLSVTVRNEEDVETAVLQLP